MPRNLLLGFTSNQTSPPQPVYVSEESYQFPTVILGNSGTGKTYLIAQLVIQHMRAHRGVVVVEPYAQIVNLVCPFIDAEQLNQLVSIDFSDENSIVPDFFTWQAPQEKTALMKALYNSIVNTIDPNGEGLVGPVFQRLLNNTLALAFESKLRSFTALLRILTDETYRNELLTSVSHEPLLHYWNNEIGQMEKNARIESIGWLVMKLNHFVNTPSMKAWEKSNTSVSLKELILAGKPVFVHTGRSKIGDKASSFAANVICEYIALAASEKMNIREEARVETQVFLDGVIVGNNDGIVQLFSELRRFNTVTTVSLMSLSTVGKPMYNNLMGNTARWLLFPLGHAEMEQLLPQIHADNAIFGMISNLPRYTAVLLELMPEKRLVTFRVPSLDENTQANVNTDKIEPPQESVTPQTDNKPVYSYIIDIRHVSDADIRRFLETQHYEPIDNEMQFILKQISCTVHYRDNMFWVPFFGNHKAVEIMYSMIVSMFKEFPDMEVFDHQSQTVMNSGHYTVLDRDYRIGAAKFYAALNANMIQKGISPSIVAPRFVVDYQLVEDNNNLIINQKTLAQDKVRELLPKDPPYVDRPFLLVNKNTFETKIVYSWPEFIPMVLPDPQMLPCDVVSYGYKPNASNPQEKPKSKMVSWKDFSSLLPEPLSLRDAGLPGYVYYDTSRKPGLSDDLVDKLPDATLPKEYSAQLQLQQVCSVYGISIPETIFVPWVAADHGVEWISFVSSAKKALIEKYPNSSCIFSNFEGTADFQIDRNSTTGVIVSLQKPFTRWLQMSEEERLSCTGATHPLIEFIDINERSMAEAEARRGTFEKAEDSIYLTLVTKEFLYSRTQGQNVPSIVSEVFIENMLYVAAIIDSPEMTTYLTIDKLEIWKKTKEDVFRKGEENTIARLKTAMKKDSGGLYSIEDDSGIGSMALKYIKQFPELKGTYGTVIGIPHSQLTYILPVNDRRDLEFTLLRLIPTVSETYDKAVNVKRTISRHAIYMIDDRKFLCTTELIDGPEGKKITIGVLGKEVYKIIEAKGLILN